MRKAGRGAARKPRESDLQVVTEPATEAAPRDAQRIRLSDGDDDAFFQSRIRHPARDDL